MGVYDREYYREESPRGINLGDQWSMAARLIVINAALFIIDLFVGGNEHWLMQNMAAGPHSLAQPQYFWQLLTYGFAHGDISHIFWNMFGLFLFGRDVESVYGPKEFLRIYLVTVVLGGLVFAIREMAMFQAAEWHTVLGASGAVTAITLLFCVHFPKRTILLFFVLPVPAWALGMMLILGNVLGWVGSQSNTAFDVHLVGAVFAICYFKFNWRISNWIPGFKLPSKNPFKRRPNLKVHNPEAYYHDLDEEGDALLDKVKRKGIESLSASERRKLEAYSRRMQQKHR